MTQKEFSFQNRKEFLTLLVGGLLASCGKGPESDAEIKMAAKTFKMGELASAGVVTYNVLEAEYKTQLGTTSSPKIPQNRYLILRLAITNGGAKEVDLPLLSLIDSEGNAHQELHSDMGVSGWFGLLRKVGPTATEEGRVIFDVAPKDYKLEVTDGGVPGKEQLARIEIPMQFDTAEPIPAAGQGAGLPATRP
jgi:hypothetical protein